MTTPHFRATSDAGYAVEDLHDLADDGYRYEIFDGSLVVTPPPALPHAATTTNLRDRLYDQAPRHLRVVEGSAIYPNRNNYYVPDLVVVRNEALASSAIGFDPRDVLLAIEVVSPSNPTNDLVFKRELYARFGIVEYWIADRRDRSLAVLRLADDGKYADVATLHPGERWRSDTPFPLVIDPGELF